MKKLPAFLCVSVLLLSAGCGDKKKGPIEGLVQLDAGSGDSLMSLEDALAEQNAELDALRDQLAPVVGQLEQNFARVHFAYDSKQLTSESIQALADNAGLLQAHPELNVRIEGHADERGTSDYNLALGQSRAAAVRDALTTMGIAPSRLPLTSFGEEKPLESGTGEEVWSANRRAEFTVMLGHSTVLSSGL